VVGHLIKFNPETQFENSKGETTMKSILVSILLVCFVGSITFLAGQERGREKKGATTVGQLIEKKYDRFKNETIVKLKPQKIHETAEPRVELSISAEATLKGDQTGRPDKVVLVFDTVSERHFLHDEAEVVFLVDGKRIDAGTAYELNNSSGPNQIKSTLKLTIPLDTLISVINGKIVEMRLRNDVADKNVELQLSSKVISALREFAGAIT
jgi:hypothetical protein